MSFSYPAKQTTATEEDKVFLEADKHEFMDPPFCSLLYKSFTEQVPPEHSRYMCQQEQIDSRVPPRGKAHWFRLHAEHRLLFCFHYDTFKV